jgi:hypothetical protein
LASDIQTLVSEVALRLLPKTVVASIPGRETVIHLVPTRCSRKGAEYGLPRPPLIPEVVKQSRWRAAYGPNLRITPAM